MHLKTKESLVFAALAMLAVFVGQAVAQDPVTVTAIGTPLFDIANPHVFAAPTDIFPALVPNHFPRTAHSPSYAQEFADGLAMNGITEAQVFNVSDFTDPSAVHLAYVLEPNGTAPVGSSPDYADGPIIPNPINITGDVYLNGAFRAHGL